MNEGDLESFVTRSRRALDRSPSMATRATELRIVVPFLRTLGWDVHSREVVPEYEVEHAEGTVTVDHALCIDGTPAVFVVMAAAAEELAPEVGRRLADAMAGADVEWGIATNGRTYAFLSREGDDQKRVGCDLAELPDQRQLLSYYTREAAVERRDERARAVRTEVADELEADRAALVDEVHRAVVPDGFDAGPVEGELRTASEQFVDGVVGALSAGDNPGAGADSSHREDAGDGDSSGTREGNDATGAAESGEDADDSDGGDADDGSDGDDVDVSRGSTDTEYVVRFFNGRSSVGAVGHSTSGGAMAQAIEYLIEQHKLDSRLDLPWGNGEDRALVNYDPVHPDGTEMAGAEQLSNGYYVDTSVSVDISRAAVEKLAEQSGLRVMFRGAWP